MAIPEPGVIVVVTEAHGRLVTSMPFASLSHAVAHAITCSFLRAEIAWAEVREVLPGSHGRGTDLIARYERGEPVSRRSAM